MNGAALSHLMSIFFRLVRQGAHAHGLEAVEIEGLSLESRLGEIMARWSKSIDALPMPTKKPTPITHLRDGLGLPQKAVEALLLSLSHRIEPAFGPIWHGLFQGGHRLDFYKALDFIVPDPVKRLALLRLADVDGILNQLRLLEVDARGKTFACERLLAFIWGNREVDGALAPQIQGMKALELAKIGDKSLQKRLQLLRQSLGANSKQIIVFEGADKYSRLEGARALFEGGGLWVDLWGERSDKPLSLKEIGYIYREASLLGLPIIIEAGCPESQCAELKAVLRAILKGELAAQAEIPILVLNRHFKLADLSFPHKDLSLIRVARLSLEAQRNLWETHLSRFGPVDAALDVAKLSERFDMSASQIEVASQLARTLRDANGAGDDIQLADLQRGSVEVFTHELGGLAWRINPPSLGFDDLVIPLDVRRQLLMMLTYIRHRRMVYDGWGMSRLLSGGRGVKALFYGPPGTGKTLAASILAQELGLDVYQVDLSQIVSKWVGETEKNLDRVLTAAQDSQVVLLFDEADALFGERGEVKSATDRYANMEVNYLLQRFDLYDGMVILTSNLVESVDKAFSRRLHFQVEFPAPDEKEREELWQRMLGRDLPLDDDVDISRLARNFELSGGDIRNAVMGGAFLAAEDGSKVTQLHLLQSLAWEMQKQGRVPTRSAFGEHWNRLL